MIKHFRLVVSASIIAATSVTAAVSAHTPLPRDLVMDPSGHVGRVMRPPTSNEIRAARSVWTPVTAPAPFGSNGGGTAVLMTDGTVMIHDSEASWYKLTPDNTGSYINGTYSQMASLPSGYGPLYYADAILPDGKLIIEGGEYNFFKSAETSLGAIYDPVANAWTSVSPPSGWTRIGDAQSAVLSNGTFLLGNCCLKTQAELNEAALSWTIVGTGKADANSEESWSLLPSGNVLTVDVLNGTPQQSEIFNSSTGAWSNAGNTATELVEYTEIGPQILLPNGNVLATGASGNTALYNLQSGKWTAGPSFPMSNGKQLDIADGPGALLPDGKVLLVASPGAYSTPSSFFEYNGKKLVPIAGTPNASQDSSYYFRFLVLPTGQVLVTDGSNDVEIFTAGGKAKPAWAPVITSVSTTLVHGSTTSLSGVYLNGFSQAGAYGDDAQAATNYPLVRLTIAATGHVFYARTHDFSSMAVASSATVTTNFDVPASIETGAATLEVVTNGIASKPVSVTIQ